MPATSAHRQKISVVFTQKPKQERTTRGRLKVQEGRRIEVFRGAFFYCFVFFIFTLCAQLPLKYYEGLPRFFKGDINSVGKIHSVSTCHSSENFLSARALNKMEYEE